MRHFIFPVYLLFLLNNCQFTVVILYIKTISNVKFHHQYKKLLI